MKSDITKVLDTKNKKVSMHLPIGNTQDHLGKERLQVYLVPIKSIFWEDILGEFFTLDGKNDEITKA